MPSFTNEVEDLGDAIRKTYQPEGRSTQRYQRFHRRAHGETPPADPASRQERELEALRRLEDYGMFGPDVLEYDQEDHTTTLEKIKGQTLGEYLEETDPRTAHETGTAVGAMYKHLHRQGFSHHDARQFNLMVEDDHEPGDPIQMIDLEFSTDEADDADRHRDIEMLYRDIRKLEPATYNAFTDGLEEGYGRLPDATDTVTESLRQATHETVTRRAPRTGAQILANLGRDLLEEWNL